MIAIAALLVPIATTAQRPRAALARVEGRWELVVSIERARATVHRAIEEALTAMDFFVRPIARPLLRDGTRVEAWIALSVDNRERMTVRFSTGDAYTTRVGRTERRRNASGTVSVTQRMRASGQLEQVFEMEAGTRWYVYTPTGEGTMRVEVTTSGPRMPAPVYFALDYRRR